MKERSKWQRIAVIAAALLGGWLFLWLFGGVLLPFAVGFLPAKASEKAISRLQTRAKLPRWAAAGLCVGVLYILVFLVLGLAGRVLFGELQGFFRSLPTLAGSCAQPLHRLQERLLALADRFPDGIGSALRQWAEEFFRSGAGLGSKLYDWVFSFVSSLIGKAPDLALFLLTALLSGFMISAKLPSLTGLYRRKVPSLWQERISHTMEKLKGTLLCWLKAQGKLTLINFLVLTAGFLILGVEYPLLFGVGIALIDALPVFGSGVILIPWGIFQFLQHDTFLAVGLLCLYLAAMLIRTALEPRLIGKQVGLDPLLALLSLYAGFRFFGIWGMILFPMGAMFLKQIIDPD